MYSLQLQNRLEELDTLSEWVATCGETIGLSQRSLFGLELVLTELVTNIIDYAFKDGQEHSLFLELKGQSDGIEVSVMDDGCPFNPLERAELQLPDRLEEAKVGGLGIHLVRRYTNSCHYRRDQDRNILTLSILDKQDPA